MMNSNFNFSKNPFAGGQSTKIAGDNSRMINMGEDGGRRSVDEVRESQMEANASTGYIVDTTVDYSKPNNYIVDTEVDYSKKGYNAGTDDAAPVKEVQVHPYDEHEMGSASSMPSTYKNSYDQSNAVGPKNQSTPSYTNPNFNANSNQNSFNQGRLDAMRNMGGGMNSSSFNHNNFGNRGF